jgi:phthiocerol/phenolphthiocerol synthesis type-I polyketide synthase E
VKTDKSSGGGEANAGAIAVIGLSCRLPGADTPAQFWRNLRSGTESITCFSHEELLAAGVDPELLKTPEYVPVKGVISKADCFDGAFFGFSPREAALMDPQQRVFLECAWAALEDAGYEPRAYPGQIGVFAGSILSTYLLRNLWPNRELLAAAGTFQTAIGNDMTFLASRTAYQLGLRGPSISVGTACSTSLVAVHLACQSLLSFESDIAMAGGVSIHMPLVGGYRYEDGGILSPDGHCRPFDAAAQGTVSSDGAGVAVLKRLEEAVADNDFIYAIVRASAVNNDGSAKVGYTAPSVSGQARVVSEAMAMAGVDPESISLIETHGAGTLLGDPIEVAALMEAFGECEKKRFCALGAVKSNLGHVDAAAGIAGFIKAVLSLQHREIPPTLYFQRPNPQMNLEDSPFYVNNALLPMPAGEAPRRAGVSSFGIGGTNAHLILEEAPQASQDQYDQPSRARPLDLLLLSARNADALESATDQLAEYLEEKPEIDLADACYTLRRGRRGFEHRRILVAESREDAAQCLRARDPQRLLSGAAKGAKAAVTFLFPGLGDHYPGMGWELYCTEPVFREAVDNCAAILKSHLGADIRDFLYSGRNWSDPVLAPAERPLVSGPAGGAAIDLRAMFAAAKPKATGADDPAAAQPAIFVTEYALAATLRSWGIEPDAMIGHSIGEFVAAHLSGVLSLPDALKVVATRARLIQSEVKPGAMLAVPLTPEELLPLLPAGVSLGAVNAHNLCIASGEEQGIGQLEAVLRGQGVSCQRLRSTRAYHSAMMESMVEPLAGVLRGFELKPPEIPYISCITGTWITAEQATDPAYWARHLCRTVHFQKGLSTLLRKTDQVMLELGPGQGLTSHAVRERSRLSDGNQNGQVPATIPIIPTMRWSYGRQSEIAVLLGAVGQYWLAGGSLDAEQFLHREHQRRVPLPTYPFQRQRYWIDPPSADTAPTSTLAPAKKPDVADWFYAPSWKLTSSRLSPDGEPQSWLIFADPYGVGKELAGRLRGLGDTVVTVEAGPYLRHDGDSFVVNPSRSDDYACLFRELQGRELQGPQRIPTRIVHLWSLTVEDGGGLSRARFERAQESGYYSVMRLLQAMFRQGQDSPLRLDIVANNIFQVNGEPLCPEKATVRAPAMVAPQEHPGLACRVVDIDVIPDNSQARDALVTQLADEVRGHSEGTAVAYRRGRRWVQTFQPLRLPPVEESRSPFRRHGVYLITGGMGGVGLALARHLARTVQARLVLVGRTPLPERSAWADWLASHEEGESTCRKIKQIQALEELGSDVLVARADVASYDQMRGVLQATEARFGPLHGVIHAAGSIGIDTFREIGQCDIADSEKQFVAKVHGTLVLDKLLAGKPLDFCMLTSSLSAILGGLGFAAYSAANLFLDAFALWKNGADDVIWTSVDWDSWGLAEVQPSLLPAAQGLGKTVNTFVMTSDEGTSAFERILAEKDAGQVVVSSGDLHARLRQWIDADRRPAGDNMQMHERPNLSNRYEAPRGEVESTLGEIWQGLFGVSKVGRNDNFFELGGHSLLATQLNARLCSKLRVEMPLATLLQTPTIAEQALAVVNVQAQQADPEALERILAEVGSLSEPELQQMLLEPDSAFGAAGGHE